MLKKHLRKAAALLVSIATIFGTLPAMAASDEEAKENDEVVALTAEEAQNLTYDEAIEALQKGKEEQDAEKAAQIDEIKSHVSEDDTQIELTAADTDAEDGAKVYTSSVNFSGTFQSNFKVTLTTTDEAAANYDNITISIEQLDRGDTWKAILAELPNEADQRTLYQYKFSYKDADGNDVAFEDDKTTVKIENDWINANPSVYVYDETNLTRVDFSGSTDAEISGTREITSDEVYFYPDNYSEGIDTVTVQGMLKNYVQVCDFEEREALAPGTYSITANPIVQGKNNEVLDGVQVYLTNCGFPPTAPMKNDAELVVDKDGKMTLTFGPLNAVFTLLTADDGTDVHIKNKVMAADGGDYYDERINGMTVELDNYHGFYSFTNCSQRPVILDHGTNMQIDLEVDFDSAIKGYDSSDDEFKKTFTDDATGSTVEVKTTESFGSKLENATMQVTPLKNGVDGYDDAKYAMDKVWDKHGDNAGDGWEVYNYKLLDENGEEIVLSGNSKADITVEKPSSYEYLNPVIQSVDTVENTTTNLIFNTTTNSNDTKYSFTVRSLGDIAIVDKQSQNDEGDQFGSVWLIDSLKSKNEDCTSLTFAYTSYDYMEGQMGGRSAKDAKKEETAQGIKYMFSFIDMDGEGPFYYTSKNISWLEAEVPLSDKVTKDSNVYLVVENGESTFVKQLDTSTIHQNKFALDVFKITEDEPDSKVNKQYEFNNQDTANYIVKGFYNAYNNKTASIETPLSYLLVSDNKYAGTPLTYVENDYSIGEMVKQKAPSYLGQNIRNTYYYSDNATVSGEVEAKDAGEHTISAVPNEGYTWVDGTNTAKEFKWNIDKAYLRTTLTLSKSVIGIDEELPTAALSYSGFENGETPETAEDFVAPTITWPDRTTFVKGERYKVNADGGSAKNYDVRSTYTRVRILNDGQTVVEVPKEKELTYNGQVQKLFDDDVYTNTYYTISGDTEGKSANGSYRAEITLNDENYVWSDGSTSNSQSYWINIKKVPLKVTFKDETIKEGETPKLEIEYEGFVGGETAESLTKEQADNPNKFIFSNWTRAPKDMKAGNTYEVTPNMAFADYDVTAIPGTITVVAADENTEKTITANLYVPGELNTQLPGVTAYLTNGNNPLGIGGYDKVAPITPVKDNAKFKVVDGKMQVTVPVLNPVFTLQEIGECSNATIVDMKKDSETYATTDGSVSRTGRITEITVQLNDNSGHYVFNKCVEFPTLLGVDWKVPLTLDVDFAAAYTIGDINVSDNAVTIALTENYDIDAQIAVALYDENGALISVHTESANSGNVTVEETAESLAKTKKVSAFVWRGINTMNPCAEAKSEIISK